MHQLTSRYGRPEDPGALTGRDRGAHAWLTAALPGLASSVTTSERAQHPALGASRPVAVADLEDVAGAGAGTVLPADPTVV